MEEGVWSYYLVCKDCGNGNLLSCPTGSLEKGGYFPSEVKANCSWVVDGAGHGDVNIQNSGGQDRNDQTLNI